MDTEEDRTSLTEKNRHDNVQMDDGKLGIKWIEKIRTEEIRAGESVTNTNEKIREAIMRWFGHVEIQIEVGLVIRT